jgi:hypothetical protein
MVEPMGATVLENGITDEHVLWASTSGSIRVGGRRIGMVLGDDTPQLPSGVGNGFVGFIGNTGMRGYFGVPFALEGAPGTPEPLFTTYDIADGVLGRTEGDGNNWIAIGVAGTFGGSSSFSYTQAAFQRPAATVAPLTTASFTAPGQLFGGGRPSIAIADWVGHPGAAGLFDPGGSSAPTAVNLSPTVGHMTGGANALSGTWMTGSGAAVMWMASPTSVAVWNGADTGISPPTIDLSSFTSTVGNPVLLNVDFPGSISHTTSSDGLGTEYFVAAVPIASTATPPVGRIAILRWSYARPTSSSQRTDATIPSSVAITELMIGPQFQPSAGVAVYVLDTSATFVSYVERGNVVLRQITTGRPSGGGLENPPTVDMLHLGSGESAQSMVLDAGLYARDPRFPSGAVGRLALTAMFQVTGSSWELRTRSFEACIQP